MLASALIAAASLAVAAAPASAPRSIMQDDTLLLRSGAAVRDATLDEMRALGVDTVRVLAIWRDHAAAPLDLRRPAVRYPAPGFGALDGLMAAARARGVEVLLTPTGPGPAWASTCRGRPRARQACAPATAAFEEFVRVLGRRYPTQRSWAVWNEPNVADWLAPQFTARGRPASPAGYRSLLRAAHRALAATGHGRDTLLIGEIASIGQSNRGAGTRVMAAERFVRRVLCSRCGRLPGTGFALHPYTSAASGRVCDGGRPGQLPPSRLGRLRALLDRAARRGVVRRLGIWLTEAGFQTNPPDRLAGIALRAQAARINQLEWLAARRVRATAQYLLRDDRRAAGFQSGLRFAAGGPKPALAAYRLPIWVQRGDAGARIWGRVRPAGERVRVALQHRGRRWRTVRLLATDRAGVVRATVGGTAGRWRLRWTAPDGGTITSRAARAVRSCR